MNESKQFVWVDFYKEFANILLRYKHNRKELIVKIKKIYEKTGINMPTLEKDNKIIDIDPFTVFGLFNKSSMKESNRIKIISSIAELFEVKSIIPTSFDSIPVLNNQNAIFYYFIGKRDENDIDDLWHLFEAAITYANNPTEDNRTILSKYFNLIISKKGNGNSKITMSLYWIAPDYFLNLDSRNLYYIYHSKKFPTEFIETIPKIEGKINFTTYFNITDKLQKFLQSELSPFKDFKELSFEAWRYTKVINHQNKAIQQYDNIDETISDKDMYKGKYPPYTIADFLKEVYISECNYNRLVDLLKYKKNIIIQGAPGVGKTFIAKRLAYSLIGMKDTSRVKMIQFHQNYSYEDFIMGFRPSNTGFELKKGVFYNFCKKAEIDIENNYFFIIDEINRGNLSKIFGELFMLIEKDKRDTPLPMLYSDENFAVPSNVYIIGMMNTADRSLAILDYALRRRFAFFELSPAFDSEGFIQYCQKINSVKFNKLIEKIRQLNEDIKNDESLGKGFCIGHSYFCTKDEITDIWINNVIDYEIIPLLQEYWFDEPSKIDKWKNIIKEVTR